MSRQNEESPIANTTGLSRNLVRRLRRQAHSNYLRHSEKRNCLADTSSWQVAQAF